MVILAIIRAFVLVMSMGMFLLAYAVTRIIWPHTKASAFSLRRKWLKYVCLPVLNVKVQVSGKPSTGAALYVSNHRSFLDPAIISKYLDAFIIAKAEIADYPLINKGAEVTGIIWVRRESKDSRAATRQAYIDTISEGYNVLVYPEGTVSTARTILPFKRGTFNEAAKHNFQVVPVALEYRDKSDIWTIHSLLKYYLKQASKWSIQTKLSFGEPISSEDGDVLHDTAYNWIAEELASMQKDWTRAFDKEG